MTGICVWNSPVTGHAENVSLWWRHHGLIAPVIGGAHAQWGFRDKQMEV